MLNNHPMCTILGLQARRFERLQSRAPGPSTYSVSKKSDWLRKTYPSSPERDQVIQFGETFREWSDFVILGHTANLKKSQITHTHMYMHVYNVLTCMYMYVAYSRLFNTESSMLKTTFTTILPNLMAAKFCVHVHVGCACTYTCTCMYCTCMYIYQCTCTCTCMTYSTYDIHHIEYSPTASTQC